MTHTVTPSKVGATPSAFVILKVLARQCDASREFGSRKRFSVWSPVFVTEANTTKLSTSVTVLVPESETDNLEVAKPKVEQAARMSREESMVTRWGMWMLWKETSYRRL